MMSILNLIVKNHIPGDAIYIQRLLFFLKVVYPVTCDKFICILISILCYKILSVFIIITVKGNNREYKKPENHLCYQYGMKYTWWIYRGSDFKVAFKVLKVENAYYIYVE